MNSQNITYNLHKLVFLLDKIADKALHEKIDITVSQFRILMAIDHDTVSQCDIAHYWDMTEAAVSRQIDMLVELKLVRRKEDKENRRKNALYLSENGREKLAQSSFTLDKTYNEIYKAIDINEQTILVEGLHKLLKAICTNKTIDPFVSCKSHIK